MIITNQTSVDYWFGPMHLPAGSGQTLDLDDTSDTALYLIDDNVADQVNTLYQASPPLILVTSAAAPFPRPTGTPDVLHGSGSPEGLVYAPQGSLYLRRDDPAATSPYVKTTGVTLNTGWVSVIPASAPGDPVAGDLIPSAAVSREGCLFCDGTSYERASYPVLFAAIGTAFGSADSTHFNIPDLRGRLPLGAGTGTGSGATAWSLGTQPTSGAGGEQTHTLTTAQLPSHSHGINDPGHNHGPGNLNSAFGSWNISQGNQSTAPVISGETQGEIYPSVNGGATSSAATGISTQNAGDGGAHNILAPVSVINWFIVHG